MKQMFFAAYLICMICITCITCSDEGNDNPISAAVIAPSEISLERVNNTTVRVSWKDNSDNETGFSIWVRVAANADDRKIVGTVVPNVTEYAVSEGLTEGKGYFFGVQANGASEEHNSRIIYEYYMLTPMGELPSATLAGEVTSTATCIAVSYTITNTEGHTDVSYGLCWSTNKTPTIADNKLLGPGLSQNGDAILQVIPNALLDYDKTYKIRAFVTTSTGTYYSQEIAASLETAPTEIILTWNKHNKNTLPSSIELYETTDKLNGKNFHAWYAMADVSGDVELRVNLPDAAATIDNQAASFDGDCYVMVNGGYFYNGRHTGLAVVDAVVSGAVSAVRGSLNTSETEEYNSMYNVTRGVFGVNASGKPAVYWAGTDANGKAYYYNCPLPSVKGEAKYGEVSNSNPTTPQTWVPRNALSAGPVLLMNGKYPFDFTETSKGADYYLSNFEIIPYDIFGPGISPDRTAVGYREDGRVILFICDGRISNSGGATLMELAQIMKGLGCVAAVNLDGGGSTGIVVGSEHLNDMTGGNRAVVSTIGFFKKK